MLGDPRLTVIPDRMRAARGGLRRGTRGSDRGKQFPLRTFRLQPEIFAEVFFF